MRQFGGPLREQLDLSVEAASLDRFNHNFRCGQNLAQSSSPYSFSSLLHRDSLLDSLQRDRASLGAP